MMVAEYIRKRMGGMGGIVGFVITKPHLHAKGNLWLGLSGQFISLDAILLFCNHVLVMLVERKKLVVSMRIWWVN